MHKSQISRVIPWKVSFFPEDLEGAVSMTYCAQDISWNFCRSSFVLGAKHKSCIQSSLICRCVVGQDKQPTIVSDRDAARLFVGGLPHDCTEDLSADARW